MVLSGPWGVRVCSQTCPEHGSGREEETPLCVYSLVLGMPGPSGSHPGTSPCLSTPRRRHQRPLEPARQKHPAAQEKHSPRNVVKDAVASNKHETPSPSHVNGHVSHFTNSQNIWFLFTHIHEHFET